MASLEMSRWRRPPDVPASVPYIFVTYRLPRDFAGYVVRAFRVAGLELEPVEFVRAGNLEYCRDCLPLEARTRLARLPDDPAVIFERHY